MSKGTPKTLLKAIQNGIHDYSPNNPDFDEVVHRHVKDFLAQKFMTAILNHEDCEKVLQKLFEKCTKEPNNDE